MTVASIAFGFKLLAVAALWAMALIAVTLGLFFVFEADDGVGLATAALIVFVGVCGALTGVALL